MSIVFKHSSAPKWWKANAEQIFREISCVSNGIEPAFQKLTLDALQRGRLLRGSLALQMVSWVGRSLDSTRTKLLTKLLGQVELVHSAACILDDVIDKDEVRRGVPSFQARFGLPTAILTALHMVSRACENEVELLNGQRPRLALAFDRMIKGEAADVIAGFTASADPEGALGLVLEKTTPLFSAAFWYVGFVSSDDDSGFSRQCELFGESLGTLYQMANDYHDTFSIGPLARGAHDDTAVVSWSLPLHYAVRDKIIDVSEVGRSIRRGELQQIYDYWKDAGVKDRSLERLMVAKQACYENFPAEQPDELKVVIEMICDESFWSYDYGK